MKNIFFRVDGGSKIGMGHVIRCIALAEELSDDANITFLTKRGKGVSDTLKNTRYDRVSLVNHISYQDEVKMVKKILKDDDADIFVADTYHVESSHDIDENYLKEIDKIVDRTVMISPKNSMKLPYDIVINGNVFAEDLNYKTLNDDTIFLLGPRYALLRKEFRDLPDIKVKKDITNILITMGGGDPLNLTPKVIKAVDGLEKEDLHIDVVIGPSAHNKYDIQNSITDVDIDVSLLQNPTNISKHMLNADIAISAGGSTLYELAAVGIPAIVLLQTTNQKLISESMQGKGTAKVLGFGDEVKVDEIKDCIEDLMRDKERRKCMSEEGKKIFDGLGAVRCAEVILKKYGW